MKIHPCLAAATLCLSMLPSIASAQDAHVATSDGSVEVSTGVGLGYLSASEFVFDGGFKESQLDYRSKAVDISSTTLKAQLPHALSLHLNVDVGRGGDGALTDYDWSDPYFTDTSKTGWSNRSISPDTDIRHYFSGSLELARTFLLSEDLQIEALGGVKYTDVKWVADGGTYVYSEDDFRDSSGEFPAGEKAISYRQKIPSIYFGLNARETVGRLTLAGGLDGGMSFGIHDIDNHWLSDLLYHDDMRAAPTVLANASAGLSLTNNTSIYLSGAFERVFRARGDTWTTDTDSGETGVDRNVAGALFQSVLIKFGVMGSF